MGSVHEWMLAASLYLMLTLVVRIPFLARRWFLRRYSSTPIGSAPSARGETSLLDKIILGIFVTMGISAPFLASTDLLLFAQLGFSEDVAWFGTALGIVSLAGLVWTHVSLGDSWSAAVEARPLHQLCTTGAYAFARHPMYASFLLQPVVLAIVTQNWAFAALWVMWPIYAASRICVEERIMLAHFGAEYAAYRLRVGAFGPHFCRTCGYRLDCGLTDALVSQALESELSHVGEQRERIVDARGYQNVPAIDGGQAT